MTSVPSVASATVTAAFRAWLAANWDPELGLLEWRARLADAGWACPDWPHEWCGQGLPTETRELVRRELAVAGAVGLPDGVGMRLVAPTVLVHGDYEVKARFVRATVIGAVAWCQLFSEPSAGSDLAGLTTRADRDGDEWLVSGQKVWTTSAQHADLGLLLARTEWDVPKHAGITCFALPMRQPGVDVRPLRQMNGHASFNEVFLDDARVPAGHVIGELNRGWQVALTTLAYERRLAPRAPLAHAGGLLGRAHREAADEASIASEPYRWYPQRAGRVDLLASEARRTGHDAEPLVRQAIAQVHALHITSRLTHDRAAAARASGRPPGPEGSIGKLAASAIATGSAAAHSTLAGASLMLSGHDAPLDGTITEIVVSVPAASIAGGTDEIQRTIIGERVLGLPHEPDASRGVAFRDVRTSPPR